MNNDKVGNKPGKEVPKRGYALFRKKRGRFPKSIKYWNKENQHRNHSRFQILRKSVCYKIISAPTAHRVLVLKDENGIKEHSLLSPSKCRLCFGRCVRGVGIKDKECESFLFGRLQRLRTENYHVRYMKRNLRTPLSPGRRSCPPDSSSGRMESDNKISEDPRMNRSVQIRNGLENMNSSFTSELIGLVCTLGGKCTENAGHPSYKILGKDNSNSSACSSLEALLVDTELEKKVGSNKKLFPKLKDDSLDPSSLKVIESACKSTWYTFMPNAEISSKKRKLSHSDGPPSKKTVCEELNLVPTKNGNVVPSIIASPLKVPINDHKQVESQRLKSSGPKTLQKKLAVASTTHSEKKNVFIKLGSKRNRERSRKSSSPLSDPRLDGKRITKAKPKEVLLKRCKWSRNIAAFSNCVSTKNNRLGKINALKSKLVPAHNTGKQKDISSLQSSAARTELVDPRLKHSKIFPSNLSLCDNQQCSSGKEKAGTDGFTSKTLDASLSPSKLSVKSKVQVSSESPTSRIASEPLQVSSSNVSFKTSACSSSVTSPECSYSHPTSPKMKKQVVPQLQLNCSNSHSPTDFTSKSMLALLSALSVKTSVCLPPEAKANCTSEHLTSSADTPSVKASLPVSPENQAKREHSVLLEANTHNVEPKKRAKYSSHQNPLSNKCDINILSVKTASGSAISVKISEYNDSVTGNNIDVEVSSQQLEGDKAATIFRKNFSATNESRVKKLVRKQSSRDISKETLPSPSTTIASKVQSSDNLPNPNMKKSTTTFSTDTVFDRRKVPRLDKQTSSLKRKVSSSELHNKQTSSEMTSNRKSNKQASPEATPNKKSDKQASNEITSDRKSDKQASSEITSDRKSDKQASSEITSNRKNEKDSSEITSDIKSGEQASSEITSDIKSGEQASSEITSNRKSEKDSSEISSDIKSGEQASSEITSDKQASSEITSNRKSEKDSSEISSDIKSDKQASSEITAHGKSNKQASPEVTPNRKRDKQASSEITSDRKSDTQASSEITSNRKSEKDSSEITPNKKSDKQASSEITTHRKSTKQASPEVTPNRKNDKQASEITSNRKSEKDLSETTTKRKRDQQASSEIKTNRKRDKQASFDITLNRNCDKQASSELTCNRKSDKQASSEITFNKKRKKDSSEITSDIKSEKQASSEITIRRKNNNKQASPEVTPNTKSDKQATSEITSNRKRDKQASSEITSNRKSEKDSSEITTDLKSDKQASSEITSDRKSDKPASEITSNRKSEKESSETTTKRKSDKQASSEIKTDRESGKQVSFEITLNRNCDKQASSEVTFNRKSDKQNLSEVTCNRKSDKQASSEITSAIKSDKQASSEMTTRRKSNKQASLEVTLNRKSDKQDSAKITSDRKSDKQASSEITSNRKSEKDSSETTTYRLSDKQASSEITTNRKSDKQASSEVTCKRKSDKQASPAVTSNRKSYKQASYEITTNKKRDKQASYEITTNKKRDKQASSEITTNKKRDKQASYVIATNSKSDKQSSSEVTCNRKSDKQASSEITSNRKNESSEIISDRKSNKQASSGITTNEKGYKQVSPEITLNRKSDKEASSEVTSNRKNVKQASSEIPNRKSNKQASSEITSKRKSNKQASLEITSNRKTMSKSLSQKECVVPNKKCHSRSDANEKLSHPKRKQQELSKSLSLLKKSRQKLDKRNTQSVICSLKKHFVTQCQTKSSIVILNNATSSSILPFDFKVENYMEEFSSAPIKPWFKKFKVSTLWCKTLCTPHKFAARLSREFYLNFVCTDNITKPTTAMEVYDQFLQNKLSIHLIKHSNLGLLSIMQYFAIRAFKLYMSKTRKKNSSARKCLNPQPTDPVLEMEVRVDPTKNFHENSFANPTNSCSKIESAVNEVEMADSKKFPVSATGIKKNPEWEIFLQCSNLSLCFNLKNLKKDSIPSLFSEHGISFNELDRLTFYIRSKSMVLRLFACKIQKWLLRNADSKNENFPSSGVFDKPESMVLNTDCKELQDSEFVKEKRHVRVNKMSNYKFLCNNYRTVSFFESMGLKTFCLKSNVPLSNDKSLDVAPEKYITFFDLGNEQIYVLPSKLSVAYQMCDEICFKKDPKCSIFSPQERASCKLESDSKCFPPAFNTSCVMKKELSEKTPNPPITDACKSEPSMSYENNCIVSMKIKRTKFPKSLKFQIKDDSKNEVVLDPSCVLKDVDAPHPLLVHPAALTSTSLQLPESNVQPCNGSGSTPSSVAGEQLPAPQSCNDFSTTALDVTNIQVPQSEEQLTNGFSTTVLNATNVQLPPLQEPLSNINTALNTSNILHHTSEVQSCDSVCTTASNPTSAQLPVLEEQSVKDEEGSTCKGMNNSNGIALARASQAGPNVKSRAPPQDLNWLVNSLSSYLYGVDNDVDSMDIDSDESLRKSTESEMLSQDKTEDENLLSDIFEYFQSSVRNFPPSKDYQSLHTDSSMPLISQNKSEPSFPLPADSSKKSMLSFLQETSMPSLEEINSGSELCSTHRAFLPASIGDISTSNLTKQKTRSSQVSGEVSQAASKGNSKLNISRNKMSPHCPPKTSLLPSTPQETLMAGNSTKNIESQHCSHYTSDPSSPKVAVASNIRKRKSTDCSPATKKPCLDVLRQNQDSSVLPSDLASEPWNLSLPRETETSLNNCDKNSCTGAVTSNVFQADCHLKGKKFDMSSETLNSAFHGLDLFEEGKPLQLYYRHLLGTGKHVLNLDGACKDKTELSEETLESYNFNRDQLVHHQCLLRGLVHMASDPDADWDMQVDRRIAKELECIEGYELACQVLLLG